MKMKTVLLTLALVFTLTHINGQQIRYSLDSILSYRDQGLLTGKQVVVNKTDRGQPQHLELYDLTNPSVGLYASQEQTWEGGFLKRRAFSSCFLNGDTCLLNSINEFLNTNDFSDVVKLFFSQKTVTISNGTISVTTNQETRDSIIYDQEGKVSEVLKYESVLPGIWNYKGKQVYYWKNIENIDSIYFFDANGMLTERLLKSYNSLGLMVGKRSYKPANTLKREDILDYDDENRLIFTKIYTVGGLDTSLINRSYDENFMIQDWKIINFGGERVGGSEIEEFYLDDGITLDSTYQRVWDRVEMDFNIFASSKYYYTENVSTNLSNLDAYPTIQIFPNPTSNEVTIKGLTKKSENEIFIITDSVGKVVQSGRLDERGIVNVSQLQSGLYFITIDNLVSQKIIVAR